MGAGGLDIRNRVPAEECSAKPLTARKLGGLLGAALFAAEALVVRGGVPISGPAATRRIPVCKRRRHFSAGVAARQLSQRRRGAAGRDGHQRDSFTRFHHATVAVDL